MSNMPSAREHALYDARRKRASAATTAVLIVAVASVFLTGRTEFVALAMTALLAHFALPSWVGVEPRYPVPAPLAAVLEHVLSFGVPMVGVLLIYMMLTKGDVAFIGVIPVAVLIAIVFAVYRWRYLEAAMRHVRGESGELSAGGRLWRLYLGYVLGLVAAVPAAVAVSVFHWMLPLGVFAGVFMIVKLTIDLLLPQPPLKTERLAVAATRLAAMSPLLFGIPWGVVALAMATLTMPQDQWSLAALAENGIVTVYMTIASVAVFASVAVLAFAMELVAGEA